MINKRRDVFWLISSNSQLRTRLAIAQVKNDKESCICSYFFDSDGEPDIEPDTTFDAVVELFSLTSVLLLNFDLLRVSLNLFFVADNEAVVLRSEFIVNIRFLSLLLIKYYDCPWRDASMHIIKRRLTCFKWCLPFGFLLICRGSCCSSSGRVLKWTLDEAVTCDIADSCRYERRGRVIMLLCESLVFANY